MKLVKFILATSAISFAIAAILLIWNEDTAKCGVSTCKFIETLFICCSLVLIKEVAKIKNEN